VAGLAGVLDIAVGIASPRRLVRRTSATAAGVSRNPVVICTPGSTVPLR
jgi:hypothetical protein